MKPQCYLLSSGERVHLTIHQLRFDQIEVVEGELVQIEHWIPDDLLKNWSENHMKFLSLGEAVKAEAVKDADPDRNLRIGYTITVIAKTVKDALAAYDFLLRQAGYVIAYITYEEEIKV